MAPLRYDVVDVFTDRPYAGNPLPVVHGGVDLSTGQSGELPSPGIPVSAPRNT